MYGRATVVRGFKIAVGYGLLPLFLVGCAAINGSGPRGTLVAMERAIERNDDAALYALLPSRARREESFDRFRARLASDRAELRSLREEVARGLEARRDPWVALPTSAGGVATAVDTSDGWRVARADIGSGSAATPLDAARALRNALLRRSLPAVLSALSSRARGALQAEIAMLLDALADPSALEVRAGTSGGNNAESVTLRLPDGRSLVLVREGSSWRVDDVE